MAKQVVTRIKLLVAGGQATAAPPVGPALGQHGLNIGDFVRQFNDRTKNQVGSTIPVAVTVYRDKSFTFEIKSPPASELLKQAAGIAKGSPEPNRQKVGTVTVEQLREIAEKKRKDLNAADVEAAARVIRGTARSMGIVVEE